MEDKRAAERLRRVMHNVIAGNSELANELAKVRAVRELLPTRLASKKFSADVIKRIEAELDDIIATSMKEIEAIAREQIGYSDQT